MAQENENGQEKTEEPTEKRLKDAREKGDTARSQELSTAAMFVCVAAGLLFFAQGISIGAQDWMREAMVNAGSAAGREQLLFGQAGMMLVRLLWVVLPLVAVCILAGFIAPTLMGGFLISAKSLVPNPSRMSPMSNLKRIWGHQGFAELLKSLLRVAILGGVGWLYFYLQSDELLALVHQPLEVAVNGGIKLAIGVLISMAAGLSLLAAVDAPYQKWSWKNRQKMTRQELLDELKETEGKPEVKAAIRRAQQKAAKHRMMEDVPTADVVLVNPTHYAVALKYDRSGKGAPKLVAKGVEEVALAIRKIADGNRVPIVSAPPLARALYRDVEIGREIPVKLYSAVAQVLSYVYQLQAFVPGRGRMPVLPDLDVPDAPEA